MFTIQKNPAVPSFPGNLDEQRRIYDGLADIRSAYWSRFVGGVLCAAVVAGIFIAACILFGVQFINGFVSLVFHTLFIGLGFFTGWERGLNNEIVRKGMAARYTFAARFNTRPREKELLEWIRDNDFANRNIVVDLFSFAKKMEKLKANR